MENKTNRKYRNYTNEDVIKACAEVTSMGQLLRKLDLKEAGGNYANMRRTLQELGLKCEHWKGQGWNKDKQLKDWSKYLRNSQVKKHLINNRGAICESCKLTHWLESPIKLELHHIDGDRTNNELINLQILCPNCHSFTDNFRNSKKQ